MQKFFFKIVVDSLSEEQFEELLLRINRRWEPDLHDNLKSHMQDVATRVSRSRIQMNLIEGFLSRFVIGFEIQD